MRKLNPIRFFTLLVEYIKELSVYNFYRKTVQNLETTRELEQRGLRLDRLNRIYFVKNLPPEALLYGVSEPGGTEQFEKTFIAEALRVHNEMFIKNQLIDVVKTSLERIKTKDYYAYLVKIGFRFRAVTVGRTFYLLAYAICASYIIRKLIIEFPNMKAWVVNLVNQYI